MRPDLSRLCSSLGYSFSDMGLLDQALTHRSASRKLNNERLEFLGDAQVGQVIARQLYQQFPEASEGQLTRMRASLVRGQTLAAVARDMSVGDYLVLGGGELKSGGFRRDSILADALEAIIGAILLDGGAEAADEAILRWFSVRLANVSPDTAQKDAKTRLQEWLQARQRPLPDYDVTEIEGLAPRQNFTVCLTLTDSSEQFVGKGTSRRRAEQAAADLALEALTGEGA